MKHWGIINNGLILMAKFLGTFEEIENAYGKVSGVLGRS